jgi:hypothetical protein
MRRGPPRLLNPPAIHRLRGCCRSIAGPQRRDERLKLSALVAASGVSAKWRRHQSRVRLSTGRKRPFLRVQRALEREATERRGVSWREHRPLLIPIAGRFSAALASEYDLWARARTRTFDTRGVGIRRDAEARRTSTSAVSRRPLQVDEGALAGPTRRSRPHFAGRRQMHDGPPPRGKRARRLRSRVRDQRACAFALPRRSRRHGCRAGTASQASREEVVRVSARHCWTTGMLIENALHAVERVAIQNRLVLALVQVLPDRPPATP